MEGNLRLEIAARIAAAIFSRTSVTPNEEWDSEKDMADEMLGLADALIARERETRPPRLPPCEHKRRHYSSSPVPFHFCDDCGAEVNHDDR
jgi:hypothetical protein